MNRIGDPEYYPNSKTDQVKFITEIYGRFQNGETATFNIDGKNKTLVISKVFDNEDFGYRKVVVERPLKLNFQFSQERIDRIKADSGFEKIASSSKKNEKERQKEIAEGQQRQEAILNLLADLAKSTRVRCLKNRQSFLETLKKADNAKGIGLTAAEVKVIYNAK